MTRLLVALSLALAFAITGTYAAEAELPDLEANEPVLLVIHTAEDCPFCKAWRESSSGLEVARRLPKTWPHLDVVMIERKSLYGSESEALYPQQAHFLFEGRKERYQLSPPIPLFEIVRGQQVIFRSGGLQGWTNAILPKLEQLESNRRPSKPSAQSSARQQ